MNDFGMKELYGVVLKATYPIEVNGFSVEVGEVIAAFDKIQVAILDECKDFVTARGGYQNTPRVFWDTTKEIRLSLTQGVFSKLQLGLMINAKLVSQSSEKPLLISNRERLESDENSIIWLKHQPIGKIFVYETDGCKVNNFEVDEQKITLPSSYHDYIIDYQYDYDRNVTKMIVGQGLINGYLTLEGRTRVKDDKTGQTKTGILLIPKLKLVSDLSIKLGENAMPVVGRLDAIAYPTGVRGDSKAMELIFLDDDIDSDM